MNREMPKVTKAATNWKRALRVPLNLVPKGIAFPVLTGPLRGYRWIVGASTHGCWLGTYERAKQNRFVQYIRVGDCVYDVGANTGFYTLLASKLVGSAGHVVAFEPVPGNVEMLRRHVDLNRRKNIRLLELAVSNIAGQVRFATGVHNTTGHLAEGGDLVVDVAPLDEVVRDQGLPAPRLIKIDVEGAEAEVLEGAVATIRRHRPVILLSGHGYAAQTKCEAILASLGYCIEPDRDGSQDGQYESTAVYDGSR